MYGREEIAVTVHSRQSAARRRPAGARRDDTGSVAVEIALGVPIGVLVIFLVVAAFHLGRATIDVNSAAAAAARAGSLARSPAAAASAARTAATASLAGQCATVSVSVDTSNFRRGGTVTVAVACTVTSEGLTGIGIPGSVTAKAASTSPVDVYRSKSLGFAISEASSGANPSTAGA